jgi:hypothetical protein
MLTDAAYVAVGFGVLAFNRAQVMRRELGARIAGDAAEVLRAAQAQAREAERTLQAMLSDAPD